MTLNLLKFESKVERLLDANTLLSSIATILKKDIKSIYNAINRIKKKKEGVKNIRKAKETKITKRGKRAIKRDILRSPKKINKILIVEII